MWNSIKKAYSHQPNGIDENQLPGILWRSIREARRGRRVDSFFRKAWSWHFPQVASMFFLATLEAGLLLGTTSWAGPWQLWQVGA